jgi:hypothetical protein
VLIESLICEKKIFFCLKPRGFGVHEFRTGGLHAKIAAAKWNVELS